jgi:hypothetical protein
MPRAILLHIFAYRSFSHPNFLFDNLIVSAMDNITCFESFGPKCRFPKSITPNNAIAADAVCNINYGLNNYAHVHTGFLHAHRVFGSLYNRDPHRIYPPLPEG